MSNEQTQQADDPSGPGWRDVGPDEILRAGDMFETPGKWCYTVHTGLPAAKGGGGPYRRRIEPQAQATPDDPSDESCNQALAAYAGRMISVCGHLSDYGDRIQESQQVNNEQQTQQADDPSDDRYWRNVLPSEILQPDDRMRTMAGLWLRTTVPGKFARDGCGRTYRRRIEPQQPSDSEPETMEQLREQVRDLTQELKDKSDTYQICLQSHYKAGQRSTIDRLQAWLRPVLEVVADHPDDTSILAVSVLEFLPQIASRLIEE